MIEWLVDNDFIAKYKATEEEISTQRRRYSQSQSSAGNGQDHSNNQNENGSNQIDHSNSQIINQSNNQFNNQLNNQHNANVPPDAIGSGTRKRKRPTTDKNGNNSYICLNCVNSNIKRAHFWLLSSLSDRGMAPVIYHFFHEHPLQMLHLLLLFYRKQNLLAQYNAEQSSSSNQIQTVDHNEAYNGPTH